jgi:radical SAM-linked protein
MAHSQGFSPHPRISWVGAAPTGVASEAEYVELGLIHEVEPEQLRTALNAALPDGLAVEEVVITGGKAAGPGPLAELIDASRWRIELPGVERAELADAVDRLLAAGSVEVERLTKDGRRVVDIRPAVVSAQVEDSRADQAYGGGDHLTGDVTAERGTYGILTAVVRQMTPTVRPDDMLSALRVVAALRPPVPAKATRLAQGRLDDAGRLVDPLAPDRAMATAQAAGKPESGQ